MVSLPPSWLSLAPALSLTLHLPSSLEVRAMHTHEMGKSHWFGHMAEGGTGAHTVNIVIHTVYNLAQEVQIPKCYMANRNILFC